MNALPIKPEEATLVGPSFAMLLAEGKCWKCSQPTAMAAIWVPSYLEIDAEEGDRFDHQDAALLHYVCGLTQNVGDQVLAVAPWLRFTHTAGADTTYLANHCLHCETVQGDWFVFGVDGPFFPQTIEEQAKIRVSKCHGELHAIASAAESSWMSEIEA